MNAIRNVESIGTQTEPATPAPTAEAADPILVGAGDIASCTLRGDVQTAKLIDGVLANAPGKAVVFTAGDNAYETGSTANYKQCYAPNWGRFKTRTRPAPGNHDYVTPGAAAYFAYFGANAGPAGRGYYSYDLGAWHIVSLDSDIDDLPGSAQDSWLRADLIANKATCILAYWHHPLFSSSPEPDRPRDVITMWRTLYSFGASVVINGHVHLYERFSPQTPDGLFNPAAGIREFVVGTGGASPNHFTSVPLSDSEVVHGDEWGVIVLTLHATSYDWQFIPTQGTFTDAGSASCVNRGLLTF
ncbi:MAG: metallophosphoesterase family protein [Aggregatilineales bacterium]